MIEPWSEARLAQVLASVGEHLDTDPATAIAPPPVASRLRPAWPTRRWLAVAAAIAAVVVAATLAIAPVREAVADFLGIGSTSVDVVPEPEADPVGLPTIDDGLDRRSARQRRSPGWGTPCPTSPRRRSANPIASRRCPRAACSLVWSDGATTLWIHGAMMPDRRPLPEAHRRRSGRRSRSTGSATPR